MRQTENEVSRQQAARVPTVDLASYERAARAAVDELDHANIFTQREAAAWLKVCVRTVQLETKAGRLRAYRVGDKPFYLLSELRSYLAARIAEADAKAARRLRLRRAEIAGLQSQR
jgi:hypothetical protein